MPWRGARPLHETTIINWLIDFLSFLMAPRFINAETDYVVYKLSIEEVEK